MGQKHSYLVADFRSSKAVSDAILGYVNKDGRADILVNNTGGPAAGNVEQATTAQFLAAFESHLLCNQILAQALVPGMKLNKWGRIINIISTSVKSPLPGLGVSNTIRAAVANWSKTLATELAADGITVNNVLPGFTATARASSIVEDKAHKLGTSRHEILAKMVKEIPVGRMATPLEIGSAVAFLASPSAAYITGINLPVDGGRLSCL
jgi:3-oxoacyl-[acyl-carrier protein] reductase